MKKTFIPITSLSRYLSYPFLLLFIGFFLSCVYSQAEAGCDICEKRKNPPKEIASLPYVITQPGKYLLQPYYALYHHTSQQALITVQADNVWVDLRGNTLNLQGHQGAGIIIEGKKNVHIMNGSFSNSNSPNSLLDNNLSASLPALTSNIGRSDLLAFASSQFANPPHSCVGVAILPGSNNIKVQNINCNKLFIGIAGMDNVHHIEISHCTGTDCGNRSNPQDNGFSSLKGGFIVIAPSQPTESFVSTNITLRNCTASGQEGLFGIALYNSRDSSIKNCVLETTPADNLTVPGGLVAILCQDCLFQNIRDIDNHPCVQLFSCQNCYANE
jgi:parallel beta-helix repeat protein